MNIKEIIKRILFALSIFWVVFIAVLVVGGISKGYDVEWPKAIFVAFAPISLILLKWMLTRFKK